MCTSAASAGAAMQRTPSASRLAATYDLNFIAVPFLGMSPQALGNLPRSGRAGIVTSRHGELSADVSDRTHTIHRRSAALQTSVSTRRTFFEFGRRRLFASGQAS